MEKDNQYKCTEEFNVFYTLALLPELIILEILRKEVLKSRIVIFAIAPAISLSIALLILIIASFKINLKDSETIWCLTLLILTSLLFLYPIITERLIKKTQCKHFVYRKDSVIKQIIGFFFSNAQNDYVLPKISTEDKNKRFLKKKYLSKNIFTFTGLCLSVIALLIVGKLIFELIPMQPFTKITDSIVLTTCIVGILIIIGLIIFIGTKITTYTRENNQVALFRYGFNGYFSRLGFRGKHFYGFYNKQAVRLQEFCFLALNGLNRMLVMDFKYKKRANAIITIKNKKFTYPNLKGAKLPLKDEELSKAYDICVYTHSTDKKQITKEARYLLTTEFINHLKYLEKKGIEVTCCFQYGNAYILMKTKKKLFAFPLIKSIFADEKMFNPICETKDVLALIDKLQLDE